MYGCYAIGASLAVVSTCTVNRKYGELKMLYIPTAMVLTSQHPPSGMKNSTRDSFPKKSITTPRAANTKNAYENKIIVATKDLALLLLLLTLDACPTLDKHIQSFGQRVQFLSQNNISRTLYMSTT